MLGMFRSHTSPKKVIDTPAPKSNEPPTLKKFVFSSVFNMHNNSSALDSLIVFVMMNLNLDPNEIQLVPIFGGYMVRD